MVNKEDFQLYDNTPGKKKYYCWEGLILYITQIDGWQEVIYGYYNDKKNKHWALGIKRNGPENGPPSGCKYQVVAQTLAVPLLEYLKTVTDTDSHKRIIDLIIKNEREKVDNQIMEKIEKLIKIA